MAEDDEDYQLLIRNAAREAGIKIPILSVVDGEELIDFVMHRKQFTNDKQFPLPSLILLDLNMPKIDGRKAIEELKKNPDIMKIPIIVLTTSNVKEDINLVYEAGASSFIVKPSLFSSLVNIMKSIKNFWLETVTLP